MLTIAICDDMEHHIDEAKEKFKEICINQPYRLLEYTKPSLLLNDIRRDISKINILILDIELGHESGIELAIKIQKMNPFIEIIFMSAYQNYFQKVYFAPHNAFILKPLDVIYLKNAINKACLKINQNKNNCLVCISDGKKTVLNQKDILFLERQKRKTNIHTRDKTFATYESLTSILEKTRNPFFIRCHESFIINFIHIKSYKFDQAIIDNDATIMVSRKYRKDVSDAFNILAAGEIIEI